MAMRLHFRSRPNGRFRILKVVEGPLRRPDFEPLGEGNFKTGAFAADKGATFTKKQIAEVKAFITRRAAAGENRHYAEAVMLPERLRSVADWIRTAPPAQLDGLTEDLLYALHDFRESLLMRQADLDAEAEPD